VGLTVDDQITKTNFVPIDDRAGSRVEAYNRHLGIVCLTRLCFSETNLGILGVSETANGTHWIPNYHRGASHGVGSRNEAVPYSLRNQHQATGDIAGGKDMGPGGLQVLIDFDKPAMIGLDVGGSKAQPRSVGNPTYRHNCQCRLSTVPDAGPGEDHSHPSRGLLESVNGTDILVDRDTSFAKSRRNGCRHIFILTR
jgi:hypothetical protein